jgi:hypothetical protein
MIGRHHRAQRLGEGALRVGQEGHDASKGLVLLGIKDVNDRADQQRMARLLPMIAAVERAFGIDEDVGDVLDVADLVRAAPYLDQRIVARRAGVGRIKQEAVREAATPAGGQLPILALDVVDDGRARPTEQPRDDKADALVRSCRCECHDMIGPFVPEVATTQPPKEDAIFA